MVSFGGAMVALLLLISSLAFYYMTQMSSALATIGETDMPLNNAMSTITQGQLAQSAWLERSLLAAELEIKEDLERASSEFAYEHDRIESAIETALTLTSGEEMGELRESIKDVESRYSEYHESGTNLIFLLTAGDIFKAETVLKQVQIQSGELKDLIDPLSEQVSGDAQASAEALVASSNTAIATLGIIGLLAIFTALGLSIYITRTVLSQLGADPADLQNIAEHLAAGKLDFETGSVSWAGNIVRDASQAFRSDVAWLSHRVGFKGDLTVAENLDFEKGLRATDQAQYQTVLERLSLTRLTDLPFRSLSAGQQRRVALARMLLSTATLWMMDEPFTNLDKAGQTLVVDLIRAHLSEGGMCIVASHQHIEIDGSTRRVTLQ